MFLQCSQLSIHVRISSLYHYNLKPFFLNILCDAIKFMQCKWGEVRLSWTMVLRIQVQYFSVWFKLATTLHNGVVGLFLLSFFVVNMLRNTEYKPFKFFSVFREYILSQFCQSWFVEKQISFLNLSELLRKHYVVILLLTELWPRETAILFCPL